MIVLLLDEVYGAQGACGASFEKLPSRLLNDGLDINHLFKTFSPSIGHSEFNPRLKPSEITIGSGSRIVGWGAFF